jgi:hypothetical protein
MIGQELVDYIIDKFDGSIVEAFRRTCRHIKELSNTFKKNIFGG